MLINNREWLEFMQEWNMSWHLEKITPGFAKFVKKYPLHKKPRKTDYDNIISSGVLFWIFLTICLAELAMYIAGME